MANVRASQVFTRNVEDAVSARKELDAGTDFSALVEKYSVCPSKKHGGDLGWMNDESAQSLLGSQSVQKGQIIGPIHSPYGYHILKITDVMVDDAELALNSLISPLDLKSKIDSGDLNLRILDIREQWEYDIARIEGSQLITRENSTTVIGSLGKDREVVLVDWKGERSPSFQKWMSQHGFTNVKGIEGGIDAWAAAVDSRLARYDIDEDKDYHYEDLEIDTSHPDH